MQFYEPQTASMVQARGNRSRFPIENRRFAETRRLETRPDESSQVESSFRVGVFAEEGDNHLSIKSVTGCPGRNMPFPVGGKVPVGGHRFTRHRVDNFTRWKTLLEGFPSVLP
ncbi:uncharacterized protein LOC143214554 [Lasioglossum baleicum]|uniref:uncharacterized protein LOC143214554 n=1 Tax=Lasioglossum baleicum TaxID=434251 RepID=UPI003FCC3C71